MPPGIEHEPIKWVPVYSKSVRPNKDLEPRFGFNETEQALTYQFSQGRVGDGQLGKGPGTACRLDILHRAMRRTRGFPA